MDYDVTDQIICFESQDTMNRTPLLYNQYHGMTDDNLHICFSNQWTGKPNVVSITNLPFLIWTMSCKDGGIGFDGECVYPNEWNYDGINIIY